MAAVPVREPTNHGCFDEVWLSGRSRITAIPRSWAAATSALQVGERAVVGVDAAVVGHVVAVVRRRRERRHEPQPGDAEVVGRRRVAVVEVVELRRQARQVADPVAVAVGVAPDEDLGEDPVAPPAGLAERRRRGERRDRRAGGRRTAGDAGLDGGRCRADGRRRRPAGAARRRRRGRAAADDEDQPDRGEAPPATPSARLRGARPQPLTPPTVRPDTIQRCRSR